MEAYENIILNYIKHAQIKIDDIACVLFPASNLDHSNFTWSLFHILDKYKISRVSTNNVAHGWFGIAFNGTQHKCVTNFCTETIDGEDRTRFRQFWNRSGEAFVVDRYGEL